MARRKVRKRDLEQHIARQQAPYLKIYDDEIDSRDTKMMRLIDAKDGDFYQPSLNPNPGAQSAWDHIAYTGVKTDLQQELVAEARRYYGLDAPAPVTTVAVPVASPAVPVTTVAVPVTTPAVQAQKLKEDTVELVSGVSPEVQQQLDDYLGTQNLIKDIEIEQLKGNDNWNKAMMWSALAVAAGGGGFAVGTANEQNNMSEHEEAMLYALNHA